MPAGFFNRLTLTATPAESLRRERGRWHIAGFWTCSADTPGESERVGTSDAAPAHFACNFQRALFDFSRFVFVCSAASSSVFGFRFLFCFAASRGLLIFAFFSFCFLCFFWGIFEMLSAVTAVVDVVVCSVDSGGSIGWTYLLGKASECSNIDSWLI